MFDWRLQMFIERGCCRNCLVYHKLAGAHIRLADLCIRAAHLSHQLSPISL